MTEEEVRELAETLITPEAIKEKYFSHIVSRMTKAMSGAEEDAMELVTSKRFRNESQKNQTKERLHYERKNVLKVNVKLLWTELTPLTQIGANFICPRLKEKGFLYGPFHVSLLVGDVILEWNNNSLVEPRRTANPDAIIAANVGEPPELSVPIDASLHNPALVQSFVSTAKDIACTAENKLHMIDQLCKVIARYNKKQTYGTFSTNCQHFAQDLLMGLGMDREAEMFAGKSRALAQAVIDGFGCSKIYKTLAEFNSHEELNKYVTEKGESLNREDLEFCQLHYLLFHTWSTKYPERDEWKCNEGECKLGWIEDSLRGILAT